MKKPTGIVLELDKYFHGEKKLGSRLTGKVKV